MVDIDFNIFNDIFYFTKRKKKGGLFPWLDLIVCFIDLEAHISIISNLIGFEISCPLNNYSLSIPQTISSQVSHTALAHKAHHLSSSSGDLNS